MTADPRDTLVSIDDGGVLRALGKGSSAMLRTRKGVHRLVPSPPSVLLLRAAGDDPTRDVSRIVRLAGEVAGPGVLCDVVSVIAQGGARGELVVMIDGVARTIFFEGGNVVGAKSEVAGERLGEVMYRLGALGAPQVQAVIARMPFEKKRFGETAVQLGFVAREQLFHFAAKQTEEIFFAALLVARGSFYFLDGYDEVRLTARVHFSAAALLMQGVSRMDEIKYFRERIPSQEHVPVRIDARTHVPSELLATGASIEKVFAAIDGRRSVLEIGRACGLSEFEVTHAVFQLLQASLVAVNPPMPSSPDAVIAIHNDAMRRIFTIAAKHRRDTALREHLARYASSTGVLDGLMGASGPAPDGTLDARRVLKTLSSLAGDDPQTSLAQWLHAYVAFALFDLGADIPKDEHADLAREVRKCLTLLAPRSLGSVPPPGSTRGLSQRPVFGAHSSAPSAPAIPVPAAVAPFVPTSPPPPDVAPAPIVAIPPPSKTPADWPPPRPFSTAAGQPSGVLSLRKAPPPAPPRPSAEPTPLRATQRIQAPLMPRTPASPVDLVAQEAAVSVSAPISVGSPASPLGTTQMNVRPSEAPPRSSPPTHAFGSPADQAFDALALAEAAVPQTHRSVAPPPAPMTTPYVPSVPPPPPGRPMVPSMDELLDVDDAIATQQIQAAKPRRRIGLYVVVASLFCGSALGAYALFMNYRAGVGSKVVVGAPSTVANEPTTEIEAKSGKDEKDEKNEDDEEHETPAAPSTSASSAASAPSTAAVASAIPSVMPSSIPSAVTSAPPTASASTVATAPPTVGAGTGLLHTPPASAGRRVFVDGKVVGEGPGPFAVACGAHVVKVGSAGKEQKLDVPCGGEVTAPIL